VYLEDVALPGLADDVWRCQPCHLHMIYMTYHVYHGIAMIVAEIARRWAGEPRAAANQGATVP
jgi:ribosomal protein L37AE/L43A